MCRAHLGSLWHWTALVLLSSTRYLSTCNFYISLIDNHSRRRSHAWWSLLWWSLIKAALVFACSQLTLVIAKDSVSSHSQPIWSSSIPHTLLMSQDIINHTVVLCIIPSILGVRWTFRIYSLYLWRWTTRNVLLTKFISHSRACLFFGCTTCEI